MATVIEVLFEEGVLKPLEPLDFPERTRLLVTIRDERAEAQEFEALLDRVHARMRQYAPEEIEQDIAAAREEVRRMRRDPSRDH